MSSCHSLLERRGFGVTDGFGVHSGGASAWQSVRGGLRASPSPPPPPRVQRRWSQPLTPPSPTLTPITRSLPPPPTLRLESNQPCGTASSWAAEGRNAWAMRPCSCALALHQGRAGVAGHPTPPPLHLWPRHEQSCRCCCCCCSCWLLWQAGRPGGTGCGPSARACQTLPLVGAGQDA